MRLWVSWLVDWKAYHDKKCKELDFCGAVQGHGQGEDIKSLLCEVDVEEVEYTDLPDPEPCTEEL